VKAREDHGFHVDRRPGDRDTDDTVLAVPAILTSTLATHYLTSHTRESSCTAVGI
jgi:hypothetical protein